MRVETPIPTTSATGLTESLIHDSLARVPQLKVKSRNTIFRYKGKDVDAQKAGTDLGVSALVSGRVVPRGDKVEVSAELTDVRDNTIIWGQHYSRKGADIISLQQQITGDIAARLRSKLSSSEKRQVTKQGKRKNPEAYELYLKGRYYWNKRTASSILPPQSSYFNEAIAEKTPATAWRTRVSPTPILCCLALVAVPARAFLKSERCRAESVGVRPDVGTSACRAR